MTKRERREEKRKEWAKKAKSQKLEWLEDDSDLVDNLYLKDIGSHENNRKDESEQNA